MKKAQQGKKKVQFTCNSSTKGISSMKNTYFQTAITMCKATQGVETEAATRLMWWGKGLCGHIPPILQ